MAQISSISIDTSSAKKSIADLERELQETNEQLKQVDINSQAFNDLQKKAANAKGQIDQINKTTDSLSKGFQGFGENLAKVTGGISGGITAATAAMQLMGVENENVMQGIAKLQQLMAFTQGISSLKDLGEGFKTLQGSLKAVTGSLNGVKGALIGTGIGAFVVLLGTLIANWDEVTASIDSFIGTAGDASKVTAGLDAAMTAIKTSLVAVGNTIVQFVITPFKGVFNAIQTFTDTNGSVADKLKAAAKSMVNTTKDAANSVVDGFKEVGTATAKAYNDSIDQQNAEAEAKRKAEAEAKAKEQREAAKKKAEEQAKAEAEARKKAEEELDIELAKLHRSNAEDKLQQEIEIEKRRLALMKDNTLEYQNQLNKIYDLEQKLKEPTDSTTDSTEEKEDPLVTKWKDRAEAYKESLVTEKEALANQLTELNALYEQSKIDYETYQLALTDIQKQQAAIRDAEAEAEAEKQRQLIANSMAVVQSGSAFITDLLNNIADAQDTNNKEGFEKSKKLQIASATINMLTGITAAIAGLYTTKSGPWDIALAAIQAASIAASGAANIAKIKKQQYNSSSSSGSVSTNVSSATITPPTQYTQAVQGANIESKLGDNRVYVVESDIKSVQNRVSVQESENTY